MTTANLWLAAVTLACAGPALAEQGAARFTTLGTAGGPVISSQRSQPANLLVVNDGRYLVDAGDGAAERLGAAGFQPREIDGVFLSHLHLDHVGGLQGLIGIRWMLGATRPLVIYGPPGTQALVDGLIASLAPAARIGLGFGEKSSPPQAAVRVVIVRDGADFKVGVMRVRAVRNSHFTQEPNSATGEPMSLAYRFDVPGRSIGYTGDTGPNARVAQLMDNVDVLVSEVIDLPGVIADARRTMTQMPAAAERMLEAHLGAHHLTPQEAGRIATSAGAKQLVFTHLAVSGDTAAAEAALRAGAGETYRGTITVAHDLQAF